MFFPSYGFGRRAGAPVVWGLGPGMLPWDPLVASIYSTEVPIVYAENGAEYPYPTFMGKMIHPELLSAFDVRTALETPQILVSWEFDSGVTAVYPWTHIMIRRSKLRFPLLQTEGELVLDTAVPVAGDCVADLTCDPDCFYYYTMFVTYVSGDFIPILYDQKIERMLAHVVGVAKHPTEKEKVILAGRNSVRDPQIWTYNLDTMLAERVLSLSEILVAGEELAVVPFYGEQTWVGPIPPTAFVIVTTKRVLVVESDLQSDPVETDILYQWNLSVSDYPAGTSLDGAHVDPASGVLRLLNGPYKRWKTHALNTGVTTFTADLSGLTASTSLRGLDFDDDAGNILVGNDKTIYSFDPSKAAPVDGDIIQEVPLRDSLDTDFSWDIDSVSGTKVILVASNRYQRITGYNQSDPHAVSEAVRKYEGYAHSGRSYAVGGFHFRNELRKLVPEFILEQYRHDIITLPADTTFPSGFSEKAEVLFRNDTKLTLDETERICRMFGLMIDRIVDVSGLVVLNQNPLSCDPIFLDAHAKRLGIDDLDMSVPIDHQRRYIALWRQINKRKGTFWALRAVCRYYGFDIDMDVYQVQAGRFHFDTVRISEKEFVGTAGAGPSYAGTLGKTPVVPGSVMFQDLLGDQVIVDNGLGVLEGDIGIGANTISYASGAYDLTFASPLADDVHVNYQYGVGIPFDSGVPLDSYSDLSAVRIFLALYRIADQERLPSSDPITAFLLEKMKKKAPYNVKLYYLNP